MDKFYIIKDGYNVIDTFTSEEAAVNHINSLNEKYPTSGVMYQVAHVIATSRTQRIWNRP